VVSRTLHLADFKSSEAHLKAAIEERARRLAEQRRLVAEQIASGKLRAILVSHRQVVNKVLDCRLMCASDCN